MNEQEKAEAYLKAAREMLEEIESVAVIVDSDIHIEMEDDGAYVRAFAFIPKAKVEVMEGKPS